MGKYRVIETVICFYVEKYVPKIKTKRNWFGWPVGSYYDDNDMFWRPLDKRGRVIYPSTTPYFIQCRAAFDSLDEAKLFVARVRKEKLVLEL